jgi:hypothetical protein
MKRNNPEQIGLDLQPPREAGVEVEKKRFVIEKDKEIKLGIGKNKKSGFAEVFVTYPDNIMRRVRLTVFNDKTRREVRLWGGQRLNEETMKEIQDFIFSLFDDEKYVEREEKYIINPDEILTHKKKEIRDVKKAAAGDYDHEGN